MAYDINESIKGEFDISVLTKNTQPEFQPGINFIEYQINQIRPPFEKADLIITHLNWAGKAYNIAKALNKKIAYVIHNTNENAIARRHKNRVNIIYNSNYTAGLDYPQESTICIPPIFPERYKKPKTGENAILLVNCWPDKGGKILIELARKMPDRKFIGVLGGYGEQATADLKNLEYIKNTPNMADIYARAEILIQPSTYESWGKAACEAIATDTPVICTETPGLKESMDFAAIYADRTPEAYKAEIEKMDVKAQIEKCRERTEQLQRQGAEHIINLIKKLKTWEN